jgi:RNA polymerase sigma factor (sigma-70 family)
MHAGRGSGNLLEQVEILFMAGTTLGLSDRDLLERFLSERRELGEAAFTVLVERHGPMVLRVCNQALHDPHAAEDAFQATFLVLARQARSIRRRDSVESWLFGVASRAAARIRMMEARRQRYERRGVIIRLHGKTSFTDSTEPWSELHAEIARLPEKYRVPVVLCHFEGLTHEQAASRLGWPIGTVKTRLARARERLRLRLEPHGWNSTLLSSGEQLRVWGSNAAQRVLVDSTTQAAARLVAGAGPGEFVSSTVLAISQGVLRAMLITKLRLATISLLGVAAFGLGAMALARQTAEKQQALGQPMPEAEQASRTSQPAVLRAAGSTAYPPDTTVAVYPPFGCRVDRVLVALGSRVKVGDPLLELASTELTEAKSNHEMATSQWVGDKKVLDYKRPLATENQIARKELIEAENDEAQSRLKMKLAKDKLVHFGLSEQEIEDAKNQDGARKARMTLRSRADGLVIRRDVVPGNFYGVKDTLLVIARDDVLWVTASIDPRDAGKLEIGQHLTVELPYSDRTVHSKVEAISSEAERGTGKFTIRTTIPNPDRRMKAGMFVHLGIELGSTVGPATINDDPSRQNPNPNLAVRLNAVERKLERLLDEKAGRSSNEEILRRLSELERKLDRVLDRAAGE